MNAVSPRAARALLAVALLPCAAFAQERLVGARTVASGASFESWSFGDGGAVQPGLGAAGDVRVRSAAQLTVPLTVVVPIDGRWSLDLGSAYVTGVVTLADDATGKTERLRLDGLADVRLRAVGRLVGDAVLITLGANLPTGRSALDDRELGALRVLAAPALGLSTSAASGGGGGTVGLVLARRVGGWALAGGASYERRGAYQPVAALAAGIPMGADAALRFDPGDAVHLSLGADHVVGRTRTTLGITTDLFGSDRLRASPALADATVRLGPVVGVEWQLQLVPAGVRELRVYAIDRYRMSYVRDGVAVPGSSGNYLDAGVSAVWPISRASGIIAGLDGRHQTGLAVDRTFATARVHSGGLTLGVVYDVGGYRVQPALRAQRGTIVTGGHPTPATSASATLSVAARF